MRRVHVVHALETLLQAPSLTERTMESPCYTSCQPPDQAAQNDGGAGVAITGVLPPELPPGVNTLMECSGSSRHMHGDTSPQLHAAQVKHSAPRLADNLLDGVMDVDQGNGGLLQEEEEQGAEYACGHGTAKIPTTERQCVPIHSTPADAGVGIQYTVAFMEVTSRPPRRSTGGHNRMPTALASSGLALGVDVQAPAGQTEAQATEEPTGAPVANMDSERKGGKEGEQEREQGSKVGMPLRQGVSDDVNALCRQSTRCTVYHMGWLQTCTCASCAHSDSLYSPALTCMQCEAEGAAISASLTGVAAGATGQCMQCTKYGFEISGCPVQQNIQNCWAEPDPLVSIGGGTDMGSHAGTLVPVWNAGFQCMH